MACKGGVCNMAKNRGVQTQGPVTSIPVPKAKGGGFRGYDPQLLRFENFDPQQKAAILQILQQILPQIGQPGVDLSQGAPAPFDLGQYKFDFAPIAQEARQNFAQQTVPSIAERFSGLGAQKSSAFGQQLGQAASGLESSLASLGAQYGLQNRGQEAQLALQGRGLELQNRGQEAGLALQNQGQQMQKLLSLLGYGLRPTFENAYQPRQPGFGENAALALLNAAPKAAAMYFGG